MLCPNCNTESGPSLFCYVCDAYLPSTSAGTKASIPARLGAFLLDEFVCLALLIVIGVIAYSAGVHVGSSYEDFDPEALLIVLCAGALGYFLLLLWFLARGQTPGKWLMDIRAVDKRDGSEPGLGRMLLRETFGKWVSGCFFGLGWFWAIWDRDAQAWHDKIVRTAVLYRRTQTSKYLFVLVLFAAPVLSVLFLWALLITPRRPQGRGREVAVQEVSGLENQQQSNAASAREAAKQGDASAQYNLGIAYEDGYGVTQDYAQAATWFRKAAEQGDASAQYALGILYYQGQGVTQDYAEACFWITLAARRKIEGNKQEDIDTWRDGAASHLTPVELSKVQERVRKWVEEHPTKVE